jgi:hypothetical protein
VINRKRKGSQTMEETKPVRWVPFQLSPKSLVSQTYLPSIKPEAV